MEVENENELDSNKEETQNNSIRFIDGIKMIINEVNKDIEECNIKQLKDVIIILDRNFCGDDLMLKSFIEEIKIIIQNNINTKDRLGFVLLDKEYYILCPLNTKKNIDIESLYKDLNYKISKKSEINAEKLTFYGEGDNNYIYEKKISIKSGKDNKVKDDIEEEEEEEDEDDISKNNEYDPKVYESLIIKVIGFLNFFVHYSIMKENENNERYIIFFSNIFNEMNNYINTFNDEFEKIEDENLHLLIVGKLKKYATDTKRDKNIINNVFLQKLGQKSEFVEFENIKKIKTILSSNSSIVDDIIFPNEIYK